MISGASNIAEHVDKAFIFIIGISILLLVSITAVMIYFVFKYHSSKNTKPENIEGNNLLEALWIAIPTVLVLFMFYYGWTGYKVMRDVPEGAMEVHVKARMWSWLFLYENGKKNNVLYVPVGIPVKLTLSSQDVIHSFFVPAFRVKQDTVPGMETFVWFEPTKVGEYDIFCTEYCGLRHADMITKVVVMKEEEFKKWYEEEEGEAAPGISARELLDENGCLDCHTEDGTLNMAPTFKGLFGSIRTVITEGEERSIVADGPYIRKSILEPESDVVKGFEPLMPSYLDELSREDIDIIIEHLKELK